MFSAVFSGGVHGMHAYPVRVEVDLSKGLPCFELVGSVSREVKEAKERVQIALKNAGFSLPVSKITVNLSPANIVKEGTGYDLSIAAGLLSCMEVWDLNTLPDTAFLGELALNGEVRSISGVLPIAMSLKKEGIKRMIVPIDNLSECMAVPGILSVGIGDMKSFISYLQMNEQERAEKFHGCAAKMEAEEKRIEPDFLDVYGQESAKRASMIAAAGFHHMMMAGPPGAGKTMIAGRIPSVLPPLTETEKLEVASIYSIVGKLSGGLPQRRPFVSPHHTTSTQALAGGGRIPRPGLLSLAHRGILFLDEMPEFSAATLEVLRQPMEEKKVQIARSQGIYVYPADFMLVCAMNPCPCGYFPDRNKCSCTEPEIKRYLGRISGPILDRIDMFAQTNAIKPADFTKAVQGESSSVIRDRVMEARDRQKMRYSGSRYQFNGEVSGKDIKKYCLLGLKESSFLEQVFENGNMSMRSYHKVIKLSRTIADIEGKELIDTTHLAEAICFNHGRNMYWKT